MTCSDVCLTGPLYVIVEFAPNGNLRDYLKSHRPLGSSFACVSEYERPTVAMVPNNSGSSVAETKEHKALTPKDLISFAYQVALGMEYLASRQVRALYSCWFGGISPHLQHLTG